MSQEKSFEIETGTKSRRRFIQVAAAAGMAGLAGCQGNGGGDGSSGDGRSIETKFWEEWPVETKGKSVNGDAVKFEYNAVEGSPVSAVDMHFAQSETPWMREHALMIKDSFNAIGVPTNLVNVQPSTRYGEYWRADMDTRRPS